MTTAAQWLGTDSNWLWMLGLITCSICVGNNNRLWRSLGALGLAWSIFVLALKVQP